MQLKRFDRCPFHTRTPRGMDTGVAKMFSVCQSSEITIFKYHWFDFNTLTIAPSLALQ